MGTNSYNSNSNNSNSKNNNKNKKTKGKKVKPGTSSRPREKSYKPFVKYIESQATLIEKTVELNQQFHNNNYNNKKNNKNNNKNKNNKNKNRMDPNVAQPTTQSVNGPMGFTSQKRAKDNADADRHAELHSTKKTTDFTDNDKIFLLKREIDNLRSQVADPNSSFRSTEQQITSTDNSSTLMWNTMMGTNVMLLTAMVGVGMLLVTMKFMRRKLSQIRTADSLLTQYRNHDEEESSVGHQSGRHQVMVELQSQQPYPYQPQPSIAITDTTPATINTATTNMTSAEFTITDDYDDGTTTASYVAPTSTSSTTTTTIADVRLI